jgi:uncharacterized membrane protein YhiD involved in acid resistance
VWVTAALGIACGFGGWVTVAVAVMIALVLLAAMGRIELIFEGRKPRK